MGNKTGVGKGYVHGLTGERATLVQLRQKLPFAKTSELAELLGLTCVPTIDEETRDGPPNLLPKMTSGVNRKKDKDDAVTSAPSVSPYPPDRQHYRFPCLYAVEEKDVPPSDQIPEEYLKLQRFEEKIRFPEVADEKIPAPLTDWKILWPYLKTLGDAFKATGRLDTGKVINHAVRQRPLTTIPWKERAVWPLEIVLILDYSKHLCPCFKDYELLGRNLEKWFRDRLHLVLCFDASNQVFRYEGETYTGLPPVPDQACFIYAGDLGFLDRQGISSGFWHEIVGRIRRKHAGIEALLTVHPSDWIWGGTQNFQMHYWDAGCLRAGRPLSGSHAGCGGKSLAEIEILMAALSPAFEITPALIRRIRRHLNQSVSVESLVCQHHALKGNGFCFQWRSEEVRQAYAEQMGKYDIDKNEIWALIKLFESRMPIELRIEQRQKAGKPLDETQTQFLQKLVLFQQNSNTTEAEKNRVMAWVGRVADRAGEEAWVPELNNLFGVYNETAGPERIPRGVDLTQVPEWVVKSRETGPVCLSVNQNRLEIFSSGRPSHHPGLIHELSAGSKSQVTFRTDETAVKQPMTLDKPFDLPENTAEIVVETDTGRTTVAMMPCPEWASGIGRDRYGLFAEVKVKGAGFVLRWIPPGNFMMGSPKDEPERFSSEGPLHRVMFETGFWIAETACTQELWQNVTGNFQEDGLQHPVENVSWDDANDFIDGLNRLLPGLDVRLPSEAEWEYACRAGTDTPFWFGRELTPDKANYDGDVPYNNGPKGEHRKKTVPVKFFEQNPWGLYQMYGNVWEWCQDRWHDNYDGAPDNGSAWEDGDSDFRVYRGGCWINSGRYLRSAYRLEERRGGGLGGLRLARGPLGPEAGTGRSRSGYDPGAARDEKTGIMTPAGGKGDYQ